MVLSAEHRSLLNARPTAGAGHPPAHRPGPPGRPEDLSKPRNSWRWKSAARVFVAVSGRRHELLSKLDASRGAAAFALRERGFGRAFTGRNARIAGSRGG